MGWLNGEARRVLFFSNTKGDVFNKTSPLRMVLCKTTFKHKVLNITYTMKAQT